MSSVSNQHVPGYSIDQIFMGQKGGASDVINPGLLKAYGVDNDITYLVSHVKADKDISVVRDKDNHLTWKIGGQEVKLGSSWFDRMVHAVRKFFSAQYRDTFEIELGPKIDKIRRAYATCLIKEVETDLNNKISDLGDVYNKIAEIKITLDEKKSYRLKLVEQKSLQFLDEYKEYGMKNRDEKMRKDQDTMDVSASQFKSLDNEIEKLQDLLNGYETTAIRFKKEMNDLEQQANI